MTATHDPTPTEPAPTDPGGLPLLTREEWEFLVSEAHSETQFIDPVVPRIAASGPDWFANDWPESKVTRSFATVQLTRLDRADVGELRHRHFRIGQQEFRILRVLEREGHVAIVLSLWTHWLPANAMPMPTASATKP